MSSLVVYCGDVSGASVEVTVLVVADCWWGSVVGCRSCV